MSLFSRRLVFMHPNVTALLEVDEVANTGPQAFICISQIILHVIAGKLELEADVVEKFIEGLMYLLAEGSRIMVRIRVSTTMFFLFYPSTTIAVHLALFTQTCVFPDFPGATCRALACPQSHPVYVFNLLLLCAGQHILKFLISNKMDNQNDRIRIKQSIGSLQFVFTFTKPQK